MSKNLRTVRLSLLVVATIAALLLIGGQARVAQATAPLPPDPQSGSVGVEGTIGSPAPTTPATISVPTNGQSFTSEPVVVSGLCSGSLLVKLFSNGVFIGSAECHNGSYSITVALFDGQNQLVARVYDALDQAGPDSNTVTVTFVSSAANIGPQLTLTSNYAKRGATPGTPLTWPIIISGGTPPYAISIDWGDGTSPELISQTTAGTINGQHTYKQAGVYDVLVKATDQNGAEAFLQLVGVGNGAIQSTTSNSSSGTGSNGTTKTQVIWWPAAVMVPFVGLSFWLGRRYELAAIRKNIERSTEQL